MRANYPDVISDNREFDVSKKKVFILLCIFLIALSEKSVFAKESVLDEEYNLSQVQEIVDDSGVDFDMKEYAESILTGDSVVSFDNGQQVIDYLIHYVKTEIKNNMKIYKSIFGIAIASGIIAGFASIFSNDKISSAGGIVIYVAMIVILITGLLTVVDIAEKIVAVVLGFMKVLMPTYFLAVAAAGNANSAIGFYEISLVVATAVEWVFLNIFIPFTKIHAVIGLIDNMSAEKRMTKISSMIRGIQRWIIRTTVAAVSGINMIEGIILPSVDSTTVSAVSRLAQAIPGVGNTANTVASVALGSGGLIKNAIGVTGLVAVIVITMFPALRIAAASFCYNMISIIVQPFAEKTVTDCISVVADDIKMLYKMVLTLAFVVVITLAIVCVTTNR